MKDIPAARPLRILSRRVFLGACLLAAGCAHTESREDPADARELYPRVSMTTSEGTLVVELDRTRAPVSVDNFLHYVRDHQYDETIFHRVIPGFVVQGGGFDVANREKPVRAPIRLEADNGVLNARGTLAMARRSDPNSATDEFYINLADNRMLDPPPGSTGREEGYAVFGRVVEGMDVADRIAAVETGASGPFPRDAPVAPVVLRRAVRLPAAAVP